MLHTKKKGRIKRIFTFGVKNNFKLEIFSHAVELWADFIKENKLNKKEVDLASKRPPEPLTPKFAKRIANEVRLGTFDGFLPPSFIRFSSNHAKILGTRGGVSVPLSKFIINKIKEGWNPLSLRLLPRERLYVQVLASKPAPPRNTAHDCIIGVDLGSKVIITAVKVWNGDKDWELVMMEAVEEKKRKLQYYFNLNHVLSKELVKIAVNEKCAIALEALNGAKSVDELAKIRTKLWNGYPVLDLAFKIAYKAEEQGVPIIFVDPKGTTTTCSNCGNVLDKAVFKTKNRYFTCPSCGVKLHRDLNSSINIAKKAISNISSFSLRPTEC